jgi:acetolactate synthase-1/2/3 large subunit
LLRCVDAHLPDDSVLILDGGDFAASASYTVAPRRPLSFLDPGVYGTLGVGGGFALGSKSVRDNAETWIFYGDGSAAFSIAEFDTFVRHGLPVIALVGNDGGWTQIARGQEEMLGDDVGTVLRRTDYHKVAQGYGGAGILVERPEEVEPAILKAQRLARSGKPVLINALIDAGDFRAGSISI